MILGLFRVGWRIWMVSLREMRRDGFGFGFWIINEVPCAVYGAGKEHHLPHARAAGLDLAGGNAVIRTTNSDVQDPLHATKWRGMMRSVNSRLLLRPTLDTNCHIPRECYKRMEGTISMSDYLRKLLT